jgi:hypothetical protein
MGWQKPPGRETRMLVVMVLITIGVVWLAGWFISRYVFAF